MLKINPNALSVASLAGVLALSACSGDDDTQTPTPTNNNETTTQPQNIVEIASGDNRFSTLVELLGDADLVSTLEGNGPFTVFAPTNAAFEALPEGTVEALKADIPQLTAILTYHVAPESLTASAVAGRTTITTVEGRDLMVTVNGDEVRINDSLVTSTDIEASNGVIHVIDAVLLPPENNQPNTITDIAAGNADFETLVAALQAAGLDDDLMGEGPFTVFAPTDAAFEALPAGTLDALLADIPELTKILTYHVVPGDFDAAAVSAATALTSLQGADIAVRVEDGNVFVNDAQVTMTDIEASNGTIHVINAVITPPTIVDIAAGNPDFSTLVTALQAAELDDDLAGAGPFTVFAPTNAAFDALPAGTLDALLADIPELTKILTYHVVPESVDADAVVAATALTSLQGADIGVMVENDEVRVGGALVTMTNIRAGNGIIHVIDAVIIPPTIVDIAVGNPDFSTLVTALQAAELDDDLAGAGPFTVFAPTNAAFDALPAGTLDALLADIPALTDVLTYHVVSGDVRAEAVVGLTKVDTLQGTSAVVAVGDDSVGINNATIQVTDIVAGNGVIHVIDAVIQPSTITQLASYAPALSTLVTAVTAASLDDDLASPGPLTVFAPTNDAFDALPAGTLDTLLGDIPALTNILTYHVASGSFDAASVVQQSMITTLQGTSVDVTVDGAAVSIDNANVLVTDIRATNGIVHVIDGVLTP